MSRALRLTSRVLLGLVGVLVLFLTVVYGVSEARFRARYDVASMDHALAPDSALVARGAHVAAIRGCVDCHGPDLGGHTMIDDPALGRLSGSNLTAGAGGIAGRYRNGTDWDRALRHGVDPAGRALLLMPSHEYAVMSDADAQAVVAYLQSLPAVDRRPPANRVGPVGRALFLAGQIPLVPASLIDHEAVGADAPAEGPTAAYGAYLAAACTGCHGAGLAGGSMPGGGPVAANLTMDAATGLGGWTETDFARALRAGVRPDGRRLDPAMPISMTAPLTDTEVRALWAHLRTLPPTATAGA